VTLEIWLKLLRRLEATPVAILRGKRGSGPQLPRAQPREKIRLTPEKDSFYTPVRARPRRPWSIVADIARPRLGNEVTYVSIAISTYEYLFRDTSSAASSVSAGKSAAYDQSD